MMIQVHCVCGESLLVPSPGLQEPIKCPKCGRVHVSARMTTPARSSAKTWAPVAAAGAAIVVIGLVLLWALLTSNPGGRGGIGQGSGRASDGEGSGASGPSADPYAARQPGTGNGEMAGAPAGADTAVPGAPKSETGVAGQPPEPQPDKRPRSPESQPTIVIAIPDPEPPAPDPARDRAPPATTATGGTGGASGAYSARGQGGRAAAAGRGATRESEDAVEAGLAWLKKVQTKDGYWTRDGTSQDNGRPNRGLRPAGPHELGCTALATLAFLGAGHTPTADKSRYKETVRLALDWIIRQQDVETGKFSYQTFYEQGLATTALCEAYGMTKSIRYKKPAQMAIDHIIGQAGPNGGYGYSGPGDDTHVTSFQIMAMKSAMLAGLQVNRRAIDLEKQYLDASLQPDGTTGYTSQGGHDRVGVRTAVGLFCRMFLGYGRKDRTVLRIADLISKRGPQVDNVFYTYNATYAMFQMQGAYWTKWNERFRDPVIAKQVKDGELKGSWNSVTPMSGGRVVETSMYIMSLEVYYRFLPINK